MTPDPVPAWMSIAEKVAKETDNQELSRLVAQLCAALDAAANHRLKL
jgi:hypothetical protein